jgi:GrpB-like predicted nucleotidyltransferase (UPF0157 family)
MMPRSPKGLYKRFREEAAVYKMAIRDPRTPWMARVLLGAAVAYALSPIDLIPDFIPVVGHFDDVVIVPLLVWLGLRAMPTEVLAEARAAVARREVGLASGMVRVVPYNPAWADKYAEEAGRIRHAVGASAVDIQHIGSTAIPGMAAKPIIDMALGVADISIVQSMAPMLEGIGYEDRGLLNGIEGHHFFRKGNPREFFLHVFEHDGEFWVQRIAFRDDLIANPDVAAEYQGLKEGLAAEYADDRASYTAGKRAFVERVTDAAVEARVETPRHVPG